VELGCASHQFSRYGMKILLDDFNEELGSKDIFKLTIWNEISREICNDNGIRVVNFATSKNLVVKSTIHSLLYSEIQVDLS
jgi:hypothetical protein